VFGRLRKAEESASGGLEILRPARLLRNSHQQRNSLPLGESGIPGRFQWRPVLPVELVIPDRDAEGVRLQMFHQPVGCSQGLSFVTLVFRAQKQIEVSQSPLRD